ncbi:MAG: SLC13 family permease [Dehalobacterium sp.]
MSGEGKSTLGNLMLKVVFYFVIALLGWVIPAIEPMTQTGMKVFFVFLATIYGWTVTGDVWPSLFSLIMFPLTGVVDMKQFIAMGWGGDTMVFMILVFTLIKFLEVCGVSQHIAAWMMSRPFLKGHPWRLIFMIQLTAYVICSLVNIFVGMFLVWEIVYTITQASGGKPYDKFPSMMVFGIALLGALSLSAMPWGGNAIVNLAVYANIVGEPANMVRYLVFTVPYGILSIFVYMALCKFLFRLDVSPLKAIDMKFCGVDALKMTPEKRIAFTTLAVFIIMLLVPSVLPKDHPVFQIYLRMGAAGILIGIFAVLSLIQVKGQRVFNFAELATKGVPWNMVMMIAVILAIGGSLMHESTGIKAFLEQNMVPLVSGLSPALFIIAIIIMVVFLTNFTINMVIVAMFLPIVIPMAPTMGVSAEQISYLIMVASTIAVLTPAGCAAAAILFPNTKWIKVKDIYKYGVPSVIALTVLALLVNFLWLGLFY